MARHGVAPGTRYVLYVGGLSPHKNLIRLIEAFGRAGLDDGVRLILVGDLGDVFHTHVPELRAAVSRAGLRERVHFTGFVPDDDLVYLYNRAEALAQPSLLEGFGLPAVEAMACGVPVVYSRAGSLPEVVGDAGLDVDPTDVDALAAAIRRLLGDPALRRDLGGRALRRAGRFTWAESARALLDCFDEFETGRTRRIPA
jgi:glycosyltransferase involved in cell wall biosynthesis